MRIAVLFSAMLCATGSAAQAADGFFTREQAAQGMILYNDQCAECHRPDLTGAMGPALKGAAFMSRWGGKQIADLYAYEHATMPAVNPGAVPPTELWPITAFILKENGLPAGDAPLSGTTAEKVLPK